MSRPEKPIDWDLVDLLMQAGCYGTEIAACFDMHCNTFYDRVADKYGMSFTEYWSSKKCHGEANLRLRQYQKALDGDNTSLIWLGKNRLGQRDSPLEISQQLTDEEKTNYRKMLDTVSSLQDSNRDNASAIRSN